MSIYMDAEGKLVDEFECTVSFKFKEVDGALTNVAMEYMPCEQHQTIKIMSICSNIMMNKVCSLLHETNTGVSKQQYFLIMALESSKMVEFDE